MEDLDKLSKKIEELISNTWSPKTNTNFAENLKELIINTFNTNNQELSESVIERLDLIADYNKTVTILEYLRDFDKEKVMEMYNWTEHEAKYNKKIIFDKLEERKKELSKLLGDNFFDGE